VSVVIATRNRKTELRSTLGRLLDLPERPPIVVVDNGSTDGSPRMVAREFGGPVRLVRCSRNYGAAGRNIGVRVASTPYVAFSDDDSWWEAGALSRAADILDRHGRLGLLAARTLVGRNLRCDPVTRLMAASPLPPAAGLPGVPVLGFLACAAVVRRTAFLDVGGFDHLLFLGGEEELLAYDLAARGWALAHVPDLVARHAPSLVRDSGKRQAMQRRNAILVRWLRRPLSHAAAGTVEMARAALSGDQTARRALPGLLARLPSALVRRRRLPHAVERSITLLARADQAHASG
jgi:GT2 family glycosyltransferase